MISVCSEICATALKAMQEGAALRSMQGREIFRLLTNGTRYKGPRWGWRVTAAEEEGESTGDGGGHAVVGCFGGDGGRRWWRRSRVVASQSGSGIVVGRWRILVAWAAENPAGKMGFPGLEEMGESASVGGVPTGISASTWPEAEEMREPAFIDTVEGGSHGGGSVRRCEGFGAEEDGEPASSSGRGGSEMAKW